jgi:hypothetical protein
VFGPHACHASCRRYRIKRGSADVVIGGVVVASLIELDMFGDTSLLGNPKYECDVHIDVMSVRSVCARARVYVI